MSDATTTTGKAAAGAPDGDALIGHTGFVGGTLARGRHFGTLVNSKNTEALRGRHFDLLVCAGVSAVKWLANKEPEADRAGIARLTDALAETRAEEFVLISTVDVYPNPVEAADEATPIDAAANHAYGRHRLELEEWVKARFPKVRIIRLPALFGAGLRKNALYDLLNGNMVESINPAGVFQWYPMERLLSDIEIVRRSGLPLVNLVPEPLAMGRIIDRFFPGAPVGPAKQPAPLYDLHTRHGALFSPAPPPHYMLSAEEVLDAMGRYVAEEKGRARS
ncbi:NAD-dependent epimerase/dehydratase family protein [Muricoccus aerilatus]|uniref:NAD-dependent epimerase/dehydratase family protein n=1 Tax=Muricoccus aerilatus TaxID=452982 RepID=UPI000693A2E3|nr:NAD-dependent epimerase/dehydratase family protein [Roseomonas aerilata]